jgi:MvaI/BcnI restriction endonuclease family
MNLTTLNQLFADKGCKKIYAKTLAANDNSKNQVYLGGSFDILNILPFTEITSDDSGDWNKTRFKAQLDFYWLDDLGNMNNAPNSQLILYPKYPEVRFSGFLQGCSSPPSDLMANRIEGRILFLGIDSKGNVLGHVVAPGSEIENEFSITEWPDEHGVFKIIPVTAEFSQSDSRKKLIEQLTRIHNLGWIDSKRLDKYHNVLPCNSSNCGGYTLEAELDITPNGFSEPDYLGWELKQFAVKAFDKYNSSIITLMTPEPTGGIYKDLGVDVFIRQFGYRDKLGRPDRLNFGGIHKCGVKHNTTNLTLELLGFDQESGKIRDASGSISLISENDEVAASWSFTSLLKHWRRKHAQASYVPSLLQKFPTRKYSFGNNIILGTGTRFDLYLQQMSIGNIYYDPGIKMENISTKPKIKRRSQFRIKSRFLPALYEKNEVLNLLDH